MNLNYTHMVAPNGDVAKVTGPVIFSLSKIRSCLSIVLVEMHVYIMNLHVTSNLCYSSECKSGECTGVLLTMNYFFKYSRCMFFRYNEKTEYARKCVIMLVLNAVDLRIAQTVFVRIAQFWKPLTCSPAVYC